MLWEQANRAIIGTQYVAGVFDFETRNIHKKFSPAYTCMPEKPSLVPRPIPFFLFFGLHRQ